MGSPAQLIVVARLREAGHDAYVVGGAVRDLMLGRQPKDVDVATSARPDEVMELFRDLRVVPTGLAHGTVTVLVGDEPVEVTTFRVDGRYSDGRHPDEVRFVGRVEEDLARRDFTFNAMALDPTTGTIVDPFGGQEDLRRGIVRAVGDPHARFREDALRILRAVRFACRYGFEIEPQTLAAAAAQVDRLRAISWERIAQELRGILTSPHPAQGVWALRQIGALALVLPEVEACWGYDQQNPHHPDLLHEHLLKVLAGVPARWPLRLAALLHDVGKPATRTIGPDGVAHYYEHPTVGADMAATACRRLRLSGAEIDRVVMLVREHMIPVEAGPRLFRRLLRAYGLEALEDLVDLREADLSSHADHPAPGRLHQLLAQVRAEGEKAVRLAVNGHDVMAALGLAPGPRVGEILARLRELVEEDPARNERETLLKLAREI